jgi:FkbH-like protein
MTALAWLPPVADWRAASKSIDVASSGWFERLVALSQHNLDFIRVNAIDTMLKAGCAASAPKVKTIRLAILGSSTLAHLLPGIRVAALRREFLVDIYEADYGQYFQELSDAESGLHAFKPTTVLFALDAHHLAAGVNTTLSAQEADAALEEVQGRLRECWRLAREAFHCPIIQQTALPVHPGLVGSNEHRLPGSKAAFIARLNAALRPMADDAGVDLLALDDRAGRDGLVAWHDAGLWHRAKQEVSPAAAPMYGELVARLMAAKQGRSFKCLVLDLDNTLWGGVIGDDGLEGIVLGQGSALGEAHAAFQEYCRELSRRGIILAVCSKNDEANALEPFDKHPEMVLRKGDVACFVANWSDKAANIRAIAEQLNIGIDSLVFVDDNPFERTLVRQELPMVAVPEVGDDPTSFAQTLADAGYFESLAITQEDRERSGQYQGNRLREELRSSATDLPSYLRGLDMQLIWKRFDPIGLSRTVQLINKTNQFNLTTRRYTEEDVLSVMRDNRAFGLQLRLTDRFGDNGIISIVIGKMASDDIQDELEDGDLLIDTWLMSCRVLGRQVEPTTLNLVAAQAQGLGARRLVGEYVPTKKNAMVRDHYEKLGFTVASRAEDGRSRAVLDLVGFTPADTFIDVREG